MNNHCVPDFELQMDEEEEYPIPNPSSASKKPSMQNDKIMKLLWQNGQVVLQSQKQRQLRKQQSPAPARNTGAIPAEPSSAREVRPSKEAESYHNHNQHLFIQEEEMASWLHYSIDEDPPPLDHYDFCADMLYAPPVKHGGTAAATRPPIPPARRIQNFAHFSKHGSHARAEMLPPAILKAEAAAAAAARELTVVDSCETPAATATATAAAAVSGSSAEYGETGRRSVSAAGKAASSAGGRETATCEMTVTSSPGRSSGSAEPVQREPVVDRKRKGREQEESEFESEDVDIESPEAKKHVRGSTSTKRSRAAEVHNLSERRRRDRINEKMRALQELIPRCNKSDKASMLDEAIEYLKSLQLQVQMMSMGCGMVPMMFPGIQQYMPPMGMGIGMGMGMEMGMNRPVMPFPNMLASSALSAGTAASHLGPRFPMPSFHMPHVPAPDSSRMQAPNQSDNHNMPLTSLGAPDPDQSRIPNFTDYYQQYLSSQQMHFQLMQAMNQPNVTKSNTSRGRENPEKHQPG